MADKDKDNVFAVLNKIDVSDKFSTKNNLTYLPWAAAWTELKKVYPNATYTIYPQIVDEGGNTRFWHDDGRSGWVEVGVTINGVEIKEVLAIMDFKNKSIPAESITSVEANKTLKRCLTKAIALHGLALHIYMKEDLPEEVTKANDLRDKVDALAKKKAALNEKAKEKVAEFCKDAQRKASPELEEEFIIGDYKSIEDSDILEELYKKLLTIRK